jgi:uncharacterized membrane protein YbhN (UPF0104 family)
LGSVALLALLVWLADPAKLWGLLRRADLSLFGWAVGASLASSAFSAVRWAAIAKSLKLAAPLPLMALLYARGITANTVLPGAPVSGDVLRSVQLGRLGNPVAQSALSVFLDRFSGLWILCALSLVSALGAFAWQYATGQRLVAIPHALSYIIGLAAAVCIPLLPRPVPVRRKGTRLAALAGRANVALERIRSARRAMWRSVFYSICVQVAAAAGLWLCGLSIGVDLSYPVMLAAAAPIFIAGAMPIGVGGFGARETGALLVLGALGVPPGQAIGTAMLYGVASIVLGAACASAFLAKLPMPRGKRSAARTPWLRRSES